MADLATLLAELGSALHISGLPAMANPGQSIVAGLAPPLGTLSFTDIIERDISLDLIGKDVVFTNTAFGSPGWIDDAAITKIQPLFNFAAAIPTLDPSGVPGLIGRLKGKFPIAVPSQAVPKLTVAWQITDDAGTVLLEGEDFQAPAGLASPTLDVAFLPAFVVFDGGVPAPVGRRISARVTLQAGSESWTGTIGPVRVLIPAIPFPKVLALTLDTEFRGAALILVQDRSGVNAIDHLRTLLEPVRNILSTLTGIVRFANMLVGIDTLTGILDAANIEFRRGDQFDNLNDITLIQRSWYENDTEAEDELSAFVYLAPPAPPRSQENGVRMFNARSESDSEGQITVTTGPSFVALCRTLHSKRPQVMPSDATLTVDHDPSGWWVSDFGDELSSIQFL